MLRRWDELPDFMKTSEVWPYWESLWPKRWQVLVKRIFDVVVAVVLVIALSVPMAIIAILIKEEDGGPILFRQERVTAYGKRFRIHKFRTMAINAEEKGASVTMKKDQRITKVGSKLRHLRLDELPQLFDVIEGNMSFVGTRPEVVKFVEKYRPVYNATLLMPAGITSECSIKFVEEENMLEGEYDIDNVYMNRILPAKMKCNLVSVLKFSLWSDIITMLKTMTTVLGKEYKNNA